MRLATVLAVIVLGALLPATTAASSPFASAIMRDACTASGGTDGHGFVVLQAGAVEFGKSGANYMVFSARLQHLLSDGTGGVRWVTVERSRWKSDWFPNDATPWSWWYRAKFSFGRARHPLSRITMRVGFWNERPGPDELLAVHTHRGDRC